MNTEALGVFLHDNGVSDENAIKIIARITSLSAVDINAIEAALGAVGENPTLAGGALDVLKTPIEMPRGDELPPEHELPRPAPAVRPVPVVDHEAQRRLIEELESERLAAEQARDAAAARQQAEADRLAAENPTPSRWGQFMEQANPRNWRVRGEPLRWRRIGIAAGIVIIIAGAASIWYFGRDQAPEVQNSTTTEVVTITPPSPRAPNTAAPSAPASTNPAPAPLEEVTTSKSNEELADCANALLADSTLGLTKDQAISSCLEAANEEAAADDGDEPASEEATTSKSKSNEELADCANALLADSTLGLNKDQAISSCLEAANEELAANNGDESANGQ